MTRTARYKRKTRAELRAIVCLSTKTTIISQDRIYTAGAVREFMFSSRKIYLAITSSSPIMLTLQKQALTFRT